MKIKNLALAITTIFALTTASSADIARANIVQCQRAAVNFNITMNEANKAITTAHQRVRGLSKSATKRVQRKRYKRAIYTANKVKSRIYDYYKFGCVTKKTETKLIGEMNIIISKYKSDMKSI
jgi:hypothetical protein